MLKALIPATLLATVVFAPQASADRIFWWEQVNPREPGSTDGFYGNQALPGDGNTDAIVYGPDPYAEPQQQLNEDQYRREMWRRYHRTARHAPLPEVDAVAPPVVDDLPYSAPVYPVRPVKPKALAQPKTVAPKVQPDIERPKVVKSKPVVKKPEVKAPAAIQVTTLPPPPTGIPAKPKQAVASSGTISCERGATIVSSFGFEKVASKSCDKKQLAYSAERSGKAFEVDVNPVTGELIAVKKL